MKGNFELCYPILLSFVVTSIAHISFRKYLDILNSDYVMPLIIVLMVVLSLLNAISYQDIKPIRHNYTMRRLMTSKYIMRIFKHYYRTANAAAIITAVYCFVVINTVPCNNRSSYWTCYMLMYSLLCLHRSISLLRHIGFKAYVK